MRRSGFLFVLSFLFVGEIGFEIYARGVVHYHPFDRALFSCVRDREGVVSVFLNNKVICSKTHHIISRIKAQITVRCIELVDVTLLPSP